MSGAAEDSRSALLQRVRRALDGGYVFFGGKGGVGKTTCSAAFALWAAGTGRRTLVVSTDPAHSLGDLLERQLDSSPREVEKNLWALEIDPQKESQRYIKRIKDQLTGAVSPVIVEEMQRQLDAAAASPGAEEGAIFDRFVEIIESPEDEYEVVVFDTAPTGHTLRLLSLPELLAAWLERLQEKRRHAVRLSEMSRPGSSQEDAVGQDPVLAVLERRRQMFLTARSALVDQARSVFIFVLTPERLPVIETERAMGLLEQHGIPPGGVLVNQVLPETEESTFFQARREAQQGYLEDIYRRFGPRVLMEIPLEARELNREQVQELAVRMGQDFLAQV